MTTPCTGDLRVSYAPRGAGYRRASLTGESRAVEALRRRLPAPPPGQVWIGDDAAVVTPPEGPLLLAADALVAGVHADLALTTVADLGWKALAVNVSDVAAMGGRPLHALVTVALPEGGDLDGLYDGLEEAADALGCPVVGGDLTRGKELTVTVAVTGTVDDGGPGPVLRSGAAPGDVLWLTGPLGAAAAGLEALRRGRAASAPALVDAHRRPHPRVAAGSAARRARASAMLDVSDGLALDLRRLAAASAVGVEVDDVPAVAGATVEQALGGGDDYELLFAAPAASSGAVRDAFAAAGLPPPLAIGRCTASVGEHRLGGAALPEAGWEHTW